ncbi:MAG: PQQ-dependent sugar dehydrogenase [Gammaproteobacteria bacterium]
MTTLKNLVLFAWLATVSAVHSAPSFIESGEPGLRLEIVVDDIAVPWGLEFLPDGKLLYTERARAHLTVFDPVTGEKSLISGIPKLYTRDQGGLLDIELHPNFASNQILFLSYSARRGNRQTTIVARAQLRDRALVNLEEIFVAQPFFSTSKHFGSRLEFNNDHLYISVGDRHQRPAVQSLETHIGKILRINEDGSVPDDNPYVAMQNKGLRGEIFSYGHRNPQGMATHPVSGEIWIHEHGPKGGDEINIVRRGRNYGWPVITYGDEYSGGPVGRGLSHEEGMEQPLYYYKPSIAPSGMMFYSGDKFPAWRGNLFIGSLVLAHLNRLELEGEKVVREHRLFENRGWRIRVVRQGPDGYIYFATDAGFIARILPVEESS